MTAKLIKQSAVLALTGITLALGATAPIVPSEVTLTHQLSTVDYVFDTPSGDLEFGYYFKNPNIDDGGYYIRTKPADEAGWEYVESNDFPKNLTEAHPIGKGYYIFYTDGERTYRESALTTKYESQTEFLNASPKEIRTKTEFKNILSGFTDKAHAAIGYDTATNSGAQTTATSYSWSHTVTGTDTLLAVSAGVRLSNATFSVTYNSVTMTAATSTNFGTAFSFINYLAAPAAGSNTVAVTIGGGTPTSSGTGAVSLTGVDQGAPLDAVKVAIGNNVASPASVTVTTVADNAWIVDSIQTHNNTPTVGGSAELRNSVDQTSTRFFRQSTLGPVTPPAATAMTYTYSSTNIWAYSAASFVPAAAATSSPASERRTFYIE